MIAYLIGVEIPNMVAGVSIAFTSTPIYTHYAAIRATVIAAHHIILPVTVLEDQMIGGAIVWVVGSFVYISSIMTILYRLFVREGSLAPQPAINWDAHENLIAPGLEHRAHENRLRGVDLSHH